MKIKAGLMGPGGREGGRGPGGEGGRGPGGEGGRGPGGREGGKDQHRGMRGEQTNLPGENLPEHHFKKKYFNQVRFVRSLRNASGFFFLVF